MATEVISSIMPGGGGDYTTLNAWSIAEARNLVTADEIAVAEVYSGGNALSASLDLGAWTTDATRYVHIRAAGGEQHEGYWDTSKAYASSSSTDYAIRANSRSLFVTGMQIETTDSTTTDQSIPLYLIGFVPTACLVDKCIVRRSDANSGARVNQSAMVIWPADDGAVFTVQNSIIINHDNDTATGRIGIFINSGNVASVDILNCTVSCSGSFSNSFGILRIGSGPLNLKNTYIRHSIASNAVSASGLVETTSACSGTDSDVTTENVPYTTTTFTDVTLDAEELSLPATSSLIGAGTDISGDGVIDDIIGVGRPNGDDYDIGAFERVIVVAAIFDINTSLNLLSEVNTSFELRDEINTSLGLGT